MTHQKRLFFALVVVSLLAIPLMLMYFGAEMKDFMAEKQLDALLSEIRERDADISKHLLRSRSHIDLHYDSLVSAQKKMASTMTTFRSVLLNADSDMSEYADDLHLALDSRLQELERFKSLHSLITNSLRYLPKLEKTIEASLNWQDHRTVITYVNDIVIISLNLRLFPDSSTLDKADTTLLKLQNNLAMLSDDQRKLIRSFITHASNFITSSKKENLLVGQILKHRFSALLEVIERELNERQHQEIQKTRQLRIYLMIYATFLLFLVIAFIINRYHLLSNVHLHKQLSEWDPLTNLNNRRSFLRKLDVARAKAEKNSSAGAVIFIDLDGFKVINDQLGHKFGDEVLKITADRLNKLATRLSNADISPSLARLGGDEFVFLLEPTHQKLSQKLVMDIAKEIVELCAQALPEPMNRFPLSASIGISIFPMHGEDTTEILHCADKAMYYSKRKGKNRFTLYESDTSLN